MNEDLAIIDKRLKTLFKPVSQSRYWLQVVNDPYDQSYNFFFNSQRRNQHVKSIPLHRLTDYQLTYLETVITGLRTKTNLTIEFAGFTGMKWPTTQKIIQWRREGLE